MDGTHPLVWVLLVIFLGTGAVAVSYILWRFVIYPSWKASALNRRGLEAEGKLTFHGATDRGESGVFRFTEGRFTTAAGEHIDIELSRHQPLGKRTVIYLSDRPHVYKVLKYLRVP